MYTAFRPIGVGRFRAYTYRNSPGFIKLFRTRCERFEPVSFDFSAIFPDIFPIENFISARELNNRRGNAIYHGEIYQRWKIVQSGTTGLISSAEAEHLFLFSYKLFQA